MEAWGTLLVVLLALIGLIPSLRRQWRVDRAGSLRTLRVMALYAAFAAVGIAVLLALIPEEGTGDDDGLTLILLGVLLLWLFYGGLWVARLVPKYRPARKWMRPVFGLLDLFVLVPWAALLALALAR